MSQHNEIGKIGEDMATEYLTKSGYKIIEKNHKTRWMEIDVICEYKKILIFVEVRTKVGDKFGTPEDTINKQKLHKVLFSAKAYSGFKNWQGPCRIDAVCIVLKPDFSVQRLTHHENIIS